MEWNVGLGNTESEWIGGRRGGDWDGLAGQRFKKIKKRRGEGGMKFMLKEEGGGLKGGYLL